MYKGTALNPEHRAIDTLSANFGATVRSGLAAVAFLLGALYLFQGSPLPF